MKKTHPGNQMLQCCCFLNKCYFHFLLDTHLHSSSAVMEELQAQWLQPFKDFKNKRGREGGWGWGWWWREREMDISKLVMSKITILLLGPIL